MDIMDANLFTLIKLVLIFVLNTQMSRALSELQCNDSALLQEMQRCGDQFRVDMRLVHPNNRCNLTHFIRQYHVFSSCTELNAGRLGCFWPNPVVERFITHTHKFFFSNCSLERAMLIDPPTHTLTLLILTPVVLTLSMVALVVWCSRRSDLMA